MTENEHENLRYDNASAYALLSDGMRKWVAEQGWPGFRDVQSESIGTLLDAPCGTQPPNIVVSAPTSAGKALANYEPVLTDKGWKPIGELDRGDKVYGSDGVLHDIIGIYPQGKKQLYRVTLADGREIDCSEDHFWWVRDRYARSTAAGPYRKKTTGEMKEKLYEDISRRDNAWGNKEYRFSVPNTCPIVFTENDEDIDLPLDPYVLGVLIGDGCTCQKGCPNISSADTFIIEECQRRLPSEYTVKKYKGNKYGYGMHYCKSNVENPVHRLMMEWGLDVPAPLKFIPEEYFQSSVSQRKDLLAGLLDTDGSACNGSCSFHSSSSRLIRDVTRLARSLGYSVKKACKSDRSGQRITGNSQYFHQHPEYKINISSNEILFHLPRKIQDIQRYRSKKSRIHDKSHVKITDIEDMHEQVEMTCIEVDSPDHTYITKDFTVTHNTEAAFLPALSIIERYRNEHPGERFCYMLWVSPLKALLNDSKKRLDDVAKNIGCPVYLWHGDAPQGPKNEMLREHDGIILITPESLESFLVNRGQWCADYMTPLVTVVDEFHSFLGEGRGKQLLSLLDRVDVLNAQHGKPPAIRIGLSATLSQLDTVARILSPRAPYAVIDGNGAGADTMELSVKTLDPPPARGTKKPPKEDVIAIGKEIIDGSVGEKTLTFASSRLQVESISSAINDICKQDGIQSEAFPHHGSLAKELREDLERRLVETDKPTMAVATITLELGIDIGDIYKVFQVGTPKSVASLRQRIGRSGRRDGHKRGECLVTPSPLPSDMASDLVNLIAEVELMEAGWFEPPSTSRKDLSVLASETLSVLRQYGSAYEDDLFSLLVERGAFWNVPRDLFSMAVSDMVERDFMERTPEGLLILGLRGEKETESWEFYASFMSPEQYTVKNGKKTIGEIMPPDTSLMMLNQGGTFMLGGKYWEVKPPIDMRRKVIEVKPCAIRSQFLVPTSAGAGDVSGKVKKTAIRLLSGDLSGYVPGYLDEAGRERLQEAREYAAGHKLNGLGISIYDAGEEGSETDSEVRERAARGYCDDQVLTVRPPVDASTYNAIVKSLMAVGLDSANGLVNVPKWRMDEMVGELLDKWGEVEANKEELIDPAMLKDISASEKYNWVFSDETLRYAYVDEKIDLAGAKKWLEAYMRFSGSSSKIA